MSDNIAGFYEIVDLRELEAKILPFIKYDFKYVQNLSVMGVYVSYKTIIEKLIYYLASGVFYKPKIQNIKIAVDCDIFPFSYTDFRDKNNCYDCLLGLPAYFTEDEKNKALNDYVIKVNEKLKKILTS